MDLDSTLHSLRCVLASSHKNLAENVIIIIAGHKFDAVQGLPSIL